MKKSAIFLLQFAFVLSTSAQLTKRALFLGNSYTAYNNLPALTSALATSAGDILEVGSNTPGGYTFEGHSTNATSLSLIQQGNWDYVVLQEQSQLPSFPDAQVQADCFPFATALDQLISASNPCAETMFYMTWGRKFGDAGNCPTWPPVCTYEGMDDLLAERYMQMADDNFAVVSPVGKVWRYLRTNFPSIELYTADNSHPSFAGSYVAACCFYACIFEKDPLLITDNQSLSAADAEAIRNAVKTVVYDDFLTYNIGLWEPGPLAGFEFSIGSGNVVTFTNTSSNATEVTWDFGDGTTSIEVNPVHTYASSGDYSVTLTVNGCNLSDSEAITLTISELAVNDLFEMWPLTIYPNPSNDFLFVEMESGEKKVKIRSLLGHVVFECLRTQEVLELDIRDLAIGAYFLEAELNGQITRKQFVKH